MIQLIDFLTIIITKLQDKYLEEVSLTVISVINYLANIQIFNIA